MISIFKSFEHQFDTSAFLIYVKYYVKSHEKSGVKEYFPVTPPHFIIYVSDIRILDITP